jgi:hypothetical protein
MTDQEFYLSVGYLSSSQRETNIEVEMPASRQLTFVPQYAGWTNNYPLPSRTDTAPYYVWKEGTNKYGLESRVYFVSNLNMPDSLKELLEPRKTQNRPGYENWERRISQNKYIIRLFETGFILGPTQDAVRIRNLVPEEFLNDFETGFNL